MNARSIQILLDCSSSMEGEPLKIAKQIIYKIIDDLNAKDFFSLAQFGSYIESNRIRWGYALGGNKAQACQLVEKMEANLNASEIFSALEKIVMECQPKADKNIDIVLITDGHIWDGERERLSIDKIVELAVKNEQQIYTFGIGEFFCEYLFEKLAYSGGQSLLVFSESDVLKRVGEMFSSIELDGQPQLISIKESRLSGAIQVQPKAYRPSSSCIGDEIFIPPFLRSDGDSIYKGMVVKEPVFEIKLPIHFLGKAEYSYDVDFSSSKLTIDSFQHDLNILLPDDILRILIGLKPLAYDSKNSEQEVVLSFFFFMFKKPIGKYYIPNYSKYIQRIYEKMHVSPAILKELQFIFCEINLTCWRRILR